jgi:hypothetical protein
MKKFLIFLIFSILIYTSFVVVYSTDVKIGITTPYNTKRSETTSSAKAFEFFVNHRDTIESLLNNTYTTYTINYSDGNVNNPTTLTSKQIRDIVNTSYTILYAPYPLYTAEEIDTAYDAFMNLLSRGAKVFFGSNLATISSMAAVVSDKGVKYISGTPLVQRSPVVDLQTTTYFSNRVPWSTMFQVLLNNAGQAEAIIAVLNYFGIKRFGIITMTDSDMSDLCTNIQILAKKNGMTVTGTPTIPTSGSITPNIEYLKSVDTYYYILAVTNVYGNATLASLSDIGMLEPPYQYIPVWALTRRLFDMIDPKYRRGLLCMDVGRMNLDPKITNTLSTLFKQDYSPISYTWYYSLLLYFASAQLTCEQVELYYYYKDFVCNTSSINSSNQNTTSLPSLCSNTSSLLSFMTAEHTITSQGLLGKLTVVDGVSISESGILNCDNNGNCYSVGYYDPITKQVHMLPGTRIYWLGTNSYDIVPSDHRLQTELESSATVLIYVIIFSSIVILFSIICIVYVILKRKTKIVKSNSYKYLALSFFGSIMCCVSAIFCVLPPNIVSCSLRWWFLSFGFWFLFGSLALKTYRIYRIFCSVRLVTIELPDLTLFWFLLGFIGLESVICVVHQAISPYKTSTYYTTSESINDKYYYSCDSNNETLFFVISIIYKAFVLFYTGFFAFQTRDIQKFFNESKILGICIFVCTVCSVIGIPILYILNGNPNAQRGLGASLIIVVCMICVFILIFPKWIFKEDDKKKEILNDNIKNNNSLVPRVVEKPVYMPWNKFKDFILDYINNFGIKLGKKEKEEEQLFFTDCSTKIKENITDHLSPGNSHGSNSSPRSEGERPEGSSPRTSDINNGNALTITEEKVINTSGIITNDSGRKNANDPRGSANDLGINNPSIIPNISLSLAQESPREMNNSLISEKDKTPVNSPRENDTNTNTNINTNVDINIGVNITNKEKTIEMIIL